ncbi:SpaA isopeptide-forming pilin-related protein [Streptococcus hongkongensis]
MLTRIKRILVVCLTILASVGLSAAPVSAVSKTDTAELKITNIEGNPKEVKLYKIASGEYNDVGDSFVKFKYADGVKLTETGPTTAEIQKIAQGLIDGTITSLETQTMNLSGTEATKTVTGAGVYIALISGSVTHTFNPILLAASYDGENPLNAKPISAKSSYLFGETAVAKSSEPSIKKEITGGTIADGEKATAGLGDRVDYKLSVVLPSYSTAAINKTVFVSDILSDGLTFDYTSLTVSWKGQTLKANASGEFTNSAGKVIGKAHNVGNGFNLAFNYDNLETIAPTIAYSGTVNDNAKVGSIGNANTAEYFYTNNPNNGKTYDNPNTKPDPQTDESITRKEDSKTVYTYQLAFKKIDSQTKAPLKDAVFGIYSDASAKNLIDIVTTNQDGYAISTKVGKGTYYIKEITSPKGYSLNTQVYAVEASWSTATTETSASSTRSTYTSTDNGQGQVGWLKNNVFYAMNKFQGTEEGVTKAYLNSTTTTPTGTTVTEKNTAGLGTILIADIPNTKLGELPSTGSIGTYLFTALGLAVMAGAIGIYVVKRRKA